MKSFILLIVVFGVSAVMSRFLTYHWHILFDGNLAMCMMLCLTAFGHFKFTNGMGMMMPEFIPFTKNNLQQESLSSLNL